MPKLNSTEDGQEVVYGCYSCQFSRIQTSWDDRKCLKTDKKIEDECWFPEWCPLPKLPTNYERDRRRAQVKDAIGQMLKAGFARNTFSVHSSEWRPGYGRRHCPPRINLSCDIDYIMERLTDLLLADFKVTLLSDTGWMIKYAEIDWMHHSREPHLEIGLIKNCGMETARKAWKWIRQERN